jgi:hypothetical protein
LNGRAICTIAAKNYISYVHVLADSFLKYNPGIDVYVLIIDKIDGYIQPESERFKIVPIDDVIDDKLLKILFKYDLIEASTAVKPFFLEYLFNTYNLQKIIYFDPDILFTSGVDELWDLLDRYPFLLTPHLVDPLSLDEKHLRMELDILRCGIYNLGFIALSGTEKVKLFLTWWKNRLENYCYQDIAPLFVDQKWINLLPGYFDDLHILRDPGYNVAYWNLSNRKITADGDQILVNGCPLKFFHFSGLDIDKLEGISKYQDRYTLQELPEIRPLFNKYREALLAANYLNTRAWPYSFDYFDNGEKITSAIRKIYADLDADNQADKFGNPFLTGTSSFYQWLKAGSSGKFRELLAKTVWLPARSAATRLGRAAIKDPRILEGLHYIRKGIDRILFRE